MQLLKLNIYEKLWRKRSIKDINMNVNKGEVVTIIGSSGSGKSTLLRCINLLENQQMAKSSIMVKCFRTWL